MQRIAQIVAKSLSDAEHASLREATDPNTVISLEDAQSLEKLRLIETDAQRLQLTGLGTEVLRWLKAVA